MTTTHKQSAELARAPDGAFYVSGADGIWHSADGRASTWSLVPKTGVHNGGMVVSGTKIYAGNCYAYGFCAQRDIAIFQSDIGDGSTWTKVPNLPAFPEGGTFAYDEGHHILYSSNASGGLYRVVLP